MQIPSNSQDLFINSMAEKSEKIRGLFLEHIQNVTQKRPLKVMLGNGTVSDQESFDPLLASMFYEEILKKLPDWINQCVEMTTDQDLRRIFIKFHIKEGNYLLTGHMSLQYHVLLFYKLDHRVLEILKDLDELALKIENLREKVKPTSDKIIEDTLKQKGYESVDHQKLFEIMFNNDDIREELAQSLEPMESQLNDLTKKQYILFKELDKMLLEVYHTTAVMIDETRMIAAEEGCLCNFNIEYVKNNLREGNFNPSRMSQKIKNALLKRMDDIITVLEF